MSRRAGDFTTRVVVYGLAIFASLLVYGIRDFIETHKEYDKRLSAIERQVVGLQIRVDLIARHHRTEE